MKPTKKMIMSKLMDVLDPEINISIVDLGLIYDVKINAQIITIVMTLTTIGCPLISLIEKDIKIKVGELGISEKDIIIDLTFDPPWSMEKMSEKGKAILGII
ncbi:MAG: dTDP-4-keto-l-rhamnose reductase [Candidatus Roizmanbacteria bacterium GW2011_GWA2_35_19]|uniref:dTDP-4-keto-l-rhamnose reductase n=2 Tax=Candidatus Roizmaniibacteriota TaxID=1752723 RepID=A0A0G0EQ01_9BACT|nr:MAG: dTDP-4-keto-l-rhamnose reductase [Candidatus Roizmanbacteria bacterium GW2011_GWA2_35_19]